MEIHLEYEEIKLKQIMKSKFPYLGSCSIPCFSNNFREITDGEAQCIKICMQKY
jgi:hypothetical protein